MDEKTALIEETVKEIEVETKKRQARAKKKASRPAKYRYSGLEERITVIMINIKITTKVIPFIPGSSNILNDKSIRIHYCPRKIFNNTLLIII